MAKIENRSERQIHITGLPTTDAKGVVTPGATYVITAKAIGQNGLAGGGEIPDAVLADLLEKDVFTKALFESGDLSKSKSSHKSTDEDDAKAKTEAKTEHSHKR
jgi:hypothetical protein